MSRLPEHAGQPGTRLGVHAGRAERLGEEYARFTTTRPRTLVAAEPDQIRALPADIPGMWHAASTTDADRKQLLRALAEQVQVTVLGTSEKVEVGVELVWTGGHRTRTRIVRRWRD
jgi:glyoxylase-like metal-dependent hydrolase (beta-lactamase superfamily II)